MNDLDQRLAEIFEQRAGSVSGGVSPATVAHAVRRRRTRTVTGSVVATVAIATAGAVVAGAGQSGSSMHPSSTGSTPGPNGIAGTVVASLPWSEGRTLTMSYDSQDQPGFSLCVGSAQTPSACSKADAGPGISGSGGPHGFLGLAPAGTAKVVVTVHGKGAVTALLAKPDLSKVTNNNFGEGTPMLFAASGLTATLEPSGTLTTASRIEAFDASGKSLATSSTAGTADLAATHAPVNSPVPLPRFQQLGPQEFVWTAGDGWTCIGRSATVAGRARYGADECYAPTSGAELLRNQPDTTTQLFLVRVPVTATAARLVTHDGSTDDAAILHSGAGRLAIFQVDDTGLVDPAVLTLRDAAGGTLFSGDILQLPQPTPADTVSAS